MEQGWNSTEDIQADQFGPFVLVWPWSGQLCSNFVPPLPTQNRPSWTICGAKRLFSAYLDNFSAPLGPYLGHSRSGKWAKLVSLDVLGAVPTLFQPVPQKLMALAEMEKRISVQAVLV